MTDSDILIEGSAKPVMEFDDALFTNTHYDGRHSACRWHNYIPLGTLEGQQSITFKIPAIAANQECKLHEAILNVGVRIYKKGHGAHGGQSPDPGMQVAPVNNLLHALFKNVQISFDSGSSISLNTAEGNYRYKAWLENLLSYDISGKASQLSGDGWVPYNHKMMDPTPGNLIHNDSFNTRKMWFCDPQSTEKDCVYLDEEVFFSGRLLHDLCSQSKPIPPHHAINVSTNMFIL